MSDQTIPMRGAWVLITRPLPTAIQLPLLAIFYAMPERVFVKGSHHISAWPKCGREYSSANLTALYKWRAGNRSLLPAEIERARELDDEGVELEQRVNVIAPWGTVSVEPHEWSGPIDTKAYLAEPGYTTREFGGTVPVTSKMEEQVFYMQQRGIDRAQALEMLSGGMKKAGVFWLQPAQEIVDTFFYRDEQPTGPWQEAA